MLYVIALFVPPLAILCAGKPWQAIGNAVLCCISVALMFIGIGFVIHLAPILWAFAAVAGRNADRRVDRLEKAIAGQGRGDS